VKSSLNWLHNRVGFRALIALFLLTAIAFSVAPLVRLLAGRTIKDYQLWFDTGRAMIAGGEIYPTSHHKFPFMYPPTAAALLAPLTLLGKGGLIASLLLVNCLAWWASIALSVRLASGETARQHALLYLIPNLVVVLYVWDSFFLGQPSLLLLALLLGGFLCLRADRFWGAGFLFAFAASVKAFPVLAMVYLIYRRYWVATISMLLSLFMLLLILPAAFRGWSLACHDLARWTDGMVLKYDEKGIAQRPGRSVGWKNQSIFGVANRLLRPADIDDTTPPDEPVFVNLADLSFKTINAIIAGIGLLLGLAYAAAMPRGGNRTTESDAIEWSLLLMLMLMFAPLSFGYLYSFLMFPLTIVVRTWFVRPDALLVKWTIAAVALLALTIPFEHWAMKYGNVLFTTMLLFVGFVVELRRLKVGASGLIT
jgi:hypothetical protein